MYKYSIISNIYTMMAMACLVAFATMGYNINKFYYAIALLGFAGFVYLQAGTNVKRIMLFLKNRWENIPGSCVNLAPLKEWFYSSKPDVNSLGNLIDDQTWSDLNMDMMYRKIDKTLSCPGEHLLYSVLRLPLTDSVKIEQRNTLIKNFQKNNIFREKVQYQLHSVSKDKSDGITELLWKDTDVSGVMKWVSRILMTLAILSLFSIFINVDYGIITIMSIFVINALTHLYIKDHIEYNIPSVAYLRKLAICFKKIKQQKHEELNGFFNLSDAFDSSLNALLRKTKLIVPLKGVVLLSQIYDYLNMLFLLDVNSYYSSHDTIKKNRKDFQDMFNLIGEFDVLQSAAAYRNELKSYSIPEIKPGISEILLTNIKHPLLDNPVANSITIDNKGIVITGSNMAGKSTFLRTIGVNAIMAQTICTTLSDRYAGPPVHILSSVSQTDDINEGKSFYYAEAERLLKLVRKTEEKLPLLVILDEMLKGTNSTERLLASEEILKDISGRQAFVIAATHDMELDKKVSDTYKSFHFTDDVDKNGLKFDYKLKEGISDTTNAIKLLEYLKFPDRIIRNIYRQYA